jgi:hypothetical protein
VSVRANHSLSLGLSFSVLMGPPEERELFGYVGGLRCRTEERASATMDLSTCARKPVNAARTAWALPDSPWTDPRSARVCLAAGPQEANNGINLGAGARPLGRAPSGFLPKKGEHHFGVPVPRHDGSRCDVNLAPSEKREARSSSVRTPREHGYGAVSRRCEGIVRERARAGEAFDSGPRTSNVLWSIDSRRRGEGADLPRIRNRSEPKKPK